MGQTLHGEVPPGLNSPGAHTVHVLGAVKPSPGRQLASARPALLRRRIADRRVRKSARDMRFFSI